VVAPENVTIIVRKQQLLLRFWLSHISDFGGGRLRTANPTKTKTGEGFPSPVLKSKTVRVYFNALSTIDLNSFSDAAASAFGEV
jgi:hypothetical protein